MSVKYCTTVTVIGRQYFQLNDINLNNNSKVCCVKQTHRHST